ncbi:MAG: nitrile hydratase subunit alpha [Rhodospirillaceae bacterium]|nr:nitrile hydratase subunit alpha [Rhodospirillaceae bacterium]
MIRNESSVLDHYQAMELAVSALLIEKGYFTEEDMVAEINAMEKRTPEIGAAVVARAWVDAEFKERLIEDGTAACESIGLDMGPTRLMVVESTNEVHNVIVCTLCSCFPRMLMGIPPDWYKSENYRSRVVREPRAVLKEFGTVLPDGISVRVHDNTADMRYLVLPRRPDGTEGMSQEELAKLVTRNSMIGVAIVEAP